MAWYEKTFQEIVRRSATAFAVSVFFGILALIALFKVKDFWSVQTLFVGVFGIACLISGFLSFIDAFVRDHYTHIINSQNRVIKSLEKTNRGSNELAMSNYKELSTQKSTAADKFIDEGTQVK